MELRQLRYFLAIAEHGTFSKAAGKVYVAQSALSHQLAQLEEELGAQLFVRSRRGVELTEAGTVFHTYATSILRQVEDAASSVAGLTDSPAGKVVFGIPHSASHALALPLLKAVRQELPNVQLELTEELTGNLTRQLLAGSLHMAILFDDGTLGDFIAEPLVSEKMSLIYRPESKVDVPRKASISFRDALAKPLILPAQPHGVRPLIEQQAVQAGLLAPNVVADISSISILRTSLLAGLGCTILPVMPLKAELDSGALVALSIRTPQVLRVVALCRSRHIPLSTAAASVGALTAKVVRALCQQGLWVDGRYIASEIDER
ncbi:MAG: LysR family transcriptional regulator [Alcaligenaceae bacterium]|nr:MAG: LysR family transcriptional regulator [Alcaligenaceae bacterium]